MHIVTTILLLLSMIMLWLLLGHVNHPLPAELPWSRLSDVLFASGFTALNLLNLVNIITVKLR